MNQAEFTNLFNETVSELNRLLIIKGGEYAGSDDRLANFKRGAARVGIDPLQILWIYASKHIDSIETFIRDTAAGTHRERSEPIAGRFDDLINYCILAKALVKELEDAKQKVVFTGNPDQPFRRVLPGDADGRRSVPTVRDASDDQE